MRLQLLNELTATKYSKIHGISPVSPISFSVSSILRRAHVHLACPSVGTRCPRTAARGETSPAIDPVAQIRTRNELLLFNTAHMDIHVSQPFPFLGAASHAGAYSHLAWFPVMTTSSEMPLPGEELAGRMSRSPNRELERLSFSFCLTGDPLELSASPAKFRSMRTGGTTGTKGAAGAGGLSAEPMGRW
jgi:hypothetical protein